MRKGLPSPRCLFIKTIFRKDSIENRVTESGFSLNFLDLRPSLITLGVLYPNFMTNTENLLEGQNLNFDSSARTELKNRYYLNTQMPAVSKKSAKN